METYPNVSILMPTYNRRKFLPLIMYNLKNMDYHDSLILLNITKFHIDLVLEHHEMKLVRDTKMDRLEESTSNIKN